MNAELARKKSAQVVRREDRTLAYPVLQTHVIRGKSKAKVMRRLKRLSRRGYVAGASAMAYAGGGYGVKILLAKPLPPPMPRWTKWIIVSGGVIMAASGLVILALHVLASVPWVAGVAVAAVVLARRWSRPRVVNVYQNVNVR